MTALTIERSFQVRNESPQKAKPVPTVTVGRVPRVTRLMALAHRFEQMLREGVVADYATLADLGHVTRSRVCQIMNLLQLSPDIQEAVLFLPRVERGRDPVRLWELQPIAAVLDWRKQKQMWDRLMLGIR